MAITRLDPNTIFLGGEPPTRVGDLAASEAITPGHLVERFNNGGIIRYRKHTVAGGAGNHVATEHLMVNKGVDDVYAANDLMEVGIGDAGTTWWMFIASGQNIAAGDGLESAGNGTLRKLASGVQSFTALENKPTVTVQTRLRVEAV